MPLTVLERITQELFSRLSLMVNNSAYSSNISEVVRPSRFETLVPLDGQIVLAQGQQSRIRELDVPGNPMAVAYQQRFEIHFHALPDETTAIPIDGLLDAAAADIIRAIATNAQDWYSMNGLAMNSWFDPIEFITADGGMDGFTLPLIVHYRVAENDYAVLRV